MWGTYGDLARRYPKISLEVERELIAKAKRGSRKCRDEIVLRHIGFIIFRLQRKLLPPYLRRHGPEMLSAALPTLYGKVKSYDLDYRDPEGRLKPVKFASYVWKHVDGFIIMSIKKELEMERMSAGLYSEAGNDDLDAAGLRLR